MSWMLLALYAVVVVVALIAVVKVYRRIANAQRLLDQLKAEIERLEGKP